MFRKLSRIYHMLSDPAAKAAYDKWLKARDAAQRRHGELSAKRKKMKENLQSKESQDVLSRVEEEEAREMMRAEIERLREQGHEMIRKQEQLLRQQMAASSSSHHQDQEQDEEDMFPTVQVVWQKINTSVRYTRPILTDLFSKYGSLEHVGVSKKNSRALIAFQSPEDALQSLGEGGMAESPLSVSWFAGPRPHPPTARPRPTHHHTVREEEIVGGSSLEDTEALVFAKLRQAQERRQQQQDNT